MRELLFTPLPPDELDDHARYPGESCFRFFQRQCRPKFVECRAWIEDLYQEFPDNHRKESCRRLRSKKATQFQAALFEMQLYRVLRRLDLAIEIHAELPGTQQKIDFLVQGGQEACLIEATVCGFGRGIFSDTDQEYDAIAKLQKELPDPHLDIWLEAEGHLTRTLENSEITEIAARMRRHLGFFTREWLSQRGIQILPVNYGTVHAAGFQVSAEECKAEFKDDDNWTLKWTLALPPPRRGGQIHLPSRSGAPDSTGPLLKSVEAKARHWRGKDLELPLLVAVNVCHSEFVWEPDAITRALANDPDAKGSTSFVRSLHRISGVIVVGNACMGFERGAPVKLFRNGSKEIPGFLHFLEEERRFGNLLGLSCE